MGLFADFYLQLRTVGLARVGRNAETRQWCRYTEMVAASIAVLGCLSGHRVQASTMQKRPRALTTEFASFFLKSVDHLR
jgi:hypothetical protein